MLTENTAIITAAGSSVRFNNSNPDAGSCLKKEYLKLGPHPVLYLAVLPFVELPGIKACIITYRKNELEKTAAALEDLPDRGVPFHYVEGAGTRCGSVFNALKELVRLYGSTGIVSIHDGDRPFADSELIADCIKNAELFGGSVPALEVTDTLIRADSNGFCTGNIDRNSVFTVQTPQCFRLKDIYNAYRTVPDRNNFTDDAGIFTAAGYKVKITKGTETNRKITLFSDYLKEVRP